MKKPIKYKIKSCKTLKFIAKIKLKSKGTVHSKHSERDPLQLNNSCSRNKKLFP